MDNSNPFDSQVRNGVQKENRKNDAAIPPGTRIDGKIQCTRGVENLANFTSRETVLHMDKKEKSGKKYALNHAFIPDSNCNGPVKTRTKARPQDKVQQVGFLQLFRFSSRLDRLMMLVGTVGCVAAGCAVPVNFIIFGNVASAFIQDASRNGTTGASEETVELFPRVTQFALQFCGIGLGLWLSMYCGVSMWSMASESHILRVRHLLFQSVIRQEMAWFDIHGSGELGSRMTDDLLKISSATGDKMAMFLQWVSMFVSGYIMALVQGWKLALAVMCVSPLLILIARSIGKVIRFYIQKEMRAYSKAAAVAREVLSSIRTVTAFNRQASEVNRYSRNLVEASRLAIRRSLLLGITAGSFWFVLFAGFAIAFMFGMTLFQWGEIHPGVVLQVFYGVSVGSMSLGHALPTLELFAVARVAARLVYDIIDRDSAIDSLSECGEKPRQVEGKLELRSVHFNYPSRPDVKVLQGFNLTITPGQTVALVGTSGAGKSTVVQLIQRFYDPDQGQILFDDHDVRDLNVGWLRKHIGFVNQEPILFAATIAENIRFGKQDATQEDIESAARTANAHDFITNLPQKYETQVGQSGTQLSGGQKQRIAIARALVSNPRVIVLDEATSALDTETESIVQEALEKAGQGRTTVIVAHRLSTVVNADKIVVIQDGCVVEQGAHRELMARGQVYYNLYQASLHTEDLHDGFIADSYKPQDLGHLLSAPTNTVDGSIKSRDSRSSRKDETESPEEKVPDKPENVVKMGKLSRMMRYNAPEWPYIAIGCLSAVCVGGIHPMFAVVFSELLRLFTFQDPEEQMKETYFLGGMMICIGAGMWLFKTLQNVCFGKSGARLTMRMRVMTFKAMLRQDMAWFDDHRNHVGSLTAVLAYDAASVEKATGVQIGTLIESVSRITVAMVIAFYFGWKLALVVVCFFPIMVLSGIVQGRMLTRFAKGDRTAQIEGSKISLETVDNIRTVASLGKERIFLDRYMAVFRTAYRKSLTRAQLYGLSYGFTQGAVMYLAYAAAFGYGSYLVQNREMEFFNVFRVFAAIIFTATAVGRTNAYTPDFAKAKLAAGKIFSLLDKIPMIDIENSSGEILDHFSGRIVFSDVTFRYPSRPDVDVLGGLSLEVKAGESLALVGASGCGKTTCVQLLERFYDPVSGGVHFDNQKASALSLNWLRSQIGVVSQEPVLFDRSIAENIAYGDNSRDVSMNDVIESARAANIHSFVEKLPLGYNTPVGEKGGQLSGGQKQRVAIARALVRNPKILLLDEATSALDSEGEKLVQEALDKAREGRTCIIIAHRLSTVLNADRIAVIKDGRVVEQGSHQQLLSKRGHYCTLYNTNTISHSEIKQST